MKQLRKSARGAGSVGGNSFVPSASFEVDLADGIQSIDVSREVPGGGAYGAVTLLVRVHAKPVGLVAIEVKDQQVSAERLASAIHEQLGPELRTLLAYEGIVLGPQERASDLLCSLDPSAISWWRDRDWAVGKEPLISVVVSTRDGTDGLRNLLRSLEKQSYPTFEVVVVDNAASDSQTQDLLDSETFDLKMIRCIEPTPGLSWARNHGVAEASGDLVAFIDDDELADRWWLTELVKAFSVRPDVGVVSGLVLPTSIDNQIILFYEDFGGHSKGRGFSVEIFDKTSHRKQHPLYPLPPFGVGANMAFTRSALQEIGGFDVALGAGTPSCSGEDTAAICDVMLSGRTAVYWPSALTYHSHRADWDSLVRQMRGYGTGITAFYSRMIAVDPRHLMTCVGLGPRALRDMFGHRTARNVEISDAFPKSLTHAEWVGMLHGPLSYAKSRRVQREARAGRRHRSEK